MGFPLVFIGRLEGGVPKFMYGLSPLALGLLWIPLLTTCLLVAAVVVSLRRATRQEGDEGWLLRTSVLGTLMAFVAFAAQWRFLLPPVLGSS